LSTNLGTRVTRPTAWPARPRSAEASFPDRQVLLSPARWQSLRARLGQNAVGTRHAAEAALTALYSGGPLAERCSWRAWMRDGSWIDFWMAYVAALSPRERRAWRRALARPARGDQARRVWQLVSARLLGDRA